MNRRESIELGNMALHSSGDSEDITRAEYHAMHDPTVFQINHRFKIKLSQLKYFTFTIIGIALLWPWNCFLSASAFYSERFEHSPQLVKIYSSTMMSVSTITSALYNYYLSQVQVGVNYKHRVNVGFSMTIGVFIIMAFSCVLNFFISMDDYVFFTGLMIMVFISAAATCLAQNGTMAIVNVMGDIYANGVMVGQAIAGVLPSIALIVSILIVGNKKSDADKKNQYVDKNYGVFIYYITASLISVLSISLLYLTNHHKVENTYKTLNHMVEEQQPLTSSDEDEEEDPEISQKTYVPFVVLWSKLKFIVLTIFLTFGITLIFPVFASTVGSVHTESDHILLQRKIFIPFVYLVWNLGDLLGRVCCGRPRLGVLIKNPKVLLIYSIARIVFIPLFLTCNVNSTSTAKSSAIINSDTWYLLLQFLFGLSNGQLCTSCFMIVGNNCDTDDEKEAAGGFTAVFLSVGLAFGSVFSYLLVLMINK